MPCCTPRNRGVVLPEPSPAQKEAYQQIRQDDRGDHRPDPSFFQSGRSFHAADGSSGADTGQNIDEIDEIIVQLNKIKRALQQAESHREVMEQTVIAS